MTGHDVWGSLWLMWATRRRFGGIKDPSKASPEEIDRLGRNMEGMIKAMVSKANKSA